MATMDLLTGIERPADPLDYNTKISAVAAAPKGTLCPLWMKFLRTVTANDEELIGFLQRYLGYCLTGLVIEHSLVFLYGGGGNGKGVFVKTVAEIFGTYAIVAPMEMFIASKIPRHPTEIAKLRGARLVVAQETERGRRWDESKLKTLTGGDKLTGRFMRGDFFDFDPTHKFLIAGNHKPQFRTVDEAIRRRFLLVPFIVNIPEKERDPDLAEKLKAEWPAILRWMMDGCLEWRAKGLMVPDKVRAATDEYLADQDVLGQWAEDCIETVKPVGGGFETTRALFGSWKRWCEARNQFFGTETAFADGLKEQLHYETHRTNKVRGFKGIRLKMDGDPELGLDGDPGPSSAEARPPSEPWDVR